MPLVARYPLQEDSGGTAYDVVGGNHGTTNGGVTQGAPGVLGTTAYDFGTSNNGWVDIGNPSGLTASDLGDSVSTLVWFKPTDLSTNEMVFSHADSDSNDDLHCPFIEGGTGDVLSFYVDTGGGGVGTNISLSNVTAGQWNMFVGVYDGSTAKAILYNGNGERHTSSSSQSGALAGTGGGWAISSRNGGDNFYDGSAAGVRIYDHALTASGVRYLYQTAKQATALGGVTP